MKNLAKLKTEVGRLYVTPAVGLSDIIENIESAIGDIEKDVDELEDKIAEEKEPDGEYEINSGLQKIYINTEKSNLLDAQIIEAFKECIEGGNGLQLLSYLNNFKKAKAA
jgi:Mg2+ and Co2+ transporter CorA